MSIDPSFLDRVAKTGGHGSARRPIPGSIDTRFAVAFSSPVRGRPGPTRRARSRAETYERLIHQNAERFARFGPRIGPAGTLETVRKGRSRRRSRIKRRTWQEGRPRVSQDQREERRWPRVISRRRRRRSTTRPFNTPWIATRNVSTFTFYCSLFAERRLPAPSPPLYDSAVARTDAPRDREPSCHRSDHRFPRVFVNRQPLRSPAASGSRRLRDFLTLAPIGGPFYRLADAGYPTA